MANRKRAYGSTKAVHKKQVSSSLNTARRMAKKVRSYLRGGDCAMAFQSLGQLNRSLARSQVHIASIRGGGAVPGSDRGGNTLYQVARKLEGKFAQKCMR